jgi:hypothetical protein
MTTAIVRENALPGHGPEEWDIGGASSSTIEGFATSISVNRGETIVFKVRTDSTRYRIDIYRLGYYGGKGGRRIATVPIDLAGAQDQPEPLLDRATGLVDAGNWQPSAAWRVSDDAVSGVYLAKLVREDGRPGESHIPFVVRDDEGASAILFQTADTTWHAYNGWGGSNLYGGCGPSTDGRAYAVSYNRPLVTRDGIGVFSGPQDFLLGVEYAAIHWLERNGFDVSYVSGVDVARAGHLLLRHKVFMDCGHDEYWSGPQRANIEHARSRGVHLMFLSGNEAYWRIRFEPSIDASATPYRTMVCYKETRDDAKIDPSPEWTGTWRDPRFGTAGGGGNPENSLTGTLFAVDSYRSDAITIPHELSRLRFWRNTPVFGTDPDASSSLVKNILGYEWDICPSDDHTPPGLVRLSSTTLAVKTLLLDYGKLIGDGIATHSLALYRHESGAIIFGAGTVYWAWGLSAEHDLETTTTDLSVQQAMVNLLAEMDVQPATLAESLHPASKSDDTVAPQSNITTIAPAADNIPLGTDVTITGTATDREGLVAGVDVSVDGGRTWRRADGLENWTFLWRPLEAGEYRIMSRAVDDSLNIEIPSAMVSTRVHGG